MRPTSGSSRDAPPPRIPDPPAPAPPPIPRGMLGSEGGTSHPVLADRFRFGIHGPSNSGLSKNARGSSGSSHGRLTRSYSFSVPFSKRFLMMLLFDPYLIIPVWDDLACTSISTFSFSSGKVEATVASCSNPRVLSRSTVNSAAASFLAASSLLPCFSHSSAISRFHCAIFAFLSALVASMRNAYLTLSSSVSSRRLRLSRRPLNLPDPADDGDRRSPRPLPRPRRLALRRR
mmetsp:Transcript_34962/g.67571  ORF Transcript_34962/g.67571 Transcript_34962/m.67571 type:complete len:232 (+) Transcript_34962:1351-2046(+)